MKSSMTDPSIQARGAGSLYCLPQLQRGHTWGWILASTGFKEETGQSCARGSENERQVLKLGKALTKKLKQSILDNCTAVFFWTYLKIISSELLLIIVFHLNILADFFFLKPILVFFL